MSKFATGKTARAIRRRELVSQLLTLVEKLPDADRALSKSHILELNDIMVLEANQPTRPRKRL